MTSSTNLKKWALGKDYKDDPWQGFTSPQFQDLLAKTGDDGEQECTLIGCVFCAWVVRGGQEH